MSDNNIQIPDYIEKAVASSNRSDDERARDEGRKPAEVMAFFGVKPGDKVAELNGGRGYFAGLLAEIVGETGRVIGHTTEGSVKRWKGNPLEKRIETYGLTNMDTCVAEMDAPGIPDGLDAVFMIMTYHDAVWSGADRANLNKAVFDCLKPGGIFGVIDHHAKEGAGTSECQTVHRIEKSSLVDEVLAAGFTLADETDILENADDPMDVGPHTKGLRDHTNRFVLKFQKPA